MERAQRRVDALRARELARLEQSGETELDHGLRTSTWWAREHDLSEKRCRRLVSVSTKAVPTFPVVVQALYDSTISWEHVCAIVAASNPRIEAQLAALQAELLVLAEHLPFEQWVRDVDAIAQQLDIDGGHDPDLDRVSHASFNLTLGGGVLKGWFTDDLAIPMAEAIDQLTDQMYRRAQADRAETPELPVPSRNELRALAIAELFKIGVGRDLSDTRPATPECTLTVDPITGDTRTLNGQLLSVAARLLLTHDSFWSLLRYSDTGAVLNYRRHKRFVTDTLRHVLHVRDGGCVFPGCRQPVAHCDAHHVIHWNNGGETSGANLAMLCRYHHRIIHRHGWTMTALPGEWFEFTTPTGSTLASQRHHHQRQPQAP